MKYETKRLLNVFGEIDGQYIVEAAPGSQKSEKRSWFQWTAMAACFCIAVASALMIPKIENTPILSIPDDETLHVASQNSTIPDSGTSYTGGLEPVTIPELSTDGMGFEGYLYYDISEQSNGNPWSESMLISTLPVYKNGAYDPSGAGIPVGLSETNMIERLNLVAEALNLEVLSIEAIGKNGEPVVGESTTEIRGKTNNGTVTVLADGGVDFSLPDEGFKIPDEYSFTLSDTADDEAENTLSYLLRSYQNLLEYQEPRAVTWGDYSIYGEFKRRYYAYDASGDDLEDILNYHFRCVRFVPNRAGNLQEIRINDWLLLAEKLGDYPIITAEEAEKRLIAGNYQTSAPVGFPGKDYLSKCELVYRTGRSEEILLPYYRFYVQLTDVMEVTAEGLKCYGAYYVPAIADEYIAELPVYAGTFN